MDREGWCAAVNGVTKSHTQLKLETTVLLGDPEHGDQGVVSCSLCFHKGLSFFVQSLLFLTMQLYGLQHASLPCHPLSPRVFSNSCPLSLRDAIQSSHPLSSLSSPAFNLSQYHSFQISLLFASGSQSIGTSVSFLPINIQG